MPDLRARANEISQDFAAHAIAVKNSTAFVKIALVLGGTCVIAVAQCATLPSVGNWPIWNVVGLCGTAAAFLGGVFFVFTEPSAAEALLHAQRALEDARDAEADSLDLAYLVGEIRRATELYGATSLMRSAVESLLAKPLATFDKFPEALIEVADRPLRVALDFQIADHWTLGIYVIDTVAKPGTRVLKCCAQVRSVKCDINAARLWPEGCGAGWIAISNRNDVVIPDVESPAMGTIFQGMLKDGDAQRYRSVVAVPIFAPESQEPWGAVVATSDQQNHFSLDDTPGVRPIEAARALAAMVALGLAAFRANNSLQTIDPNASSTVPLHRSDGLHPDQSHSQP